MLGFVSALSLLLGGGQPCQAALPQGPAVPAPIVAKTDCGWFRLDTDGEVTRLPRNWFATHTPPSQLRYTIGRTRPGRYLVLWDGKVVWRSHGLYPNEADNWAFGKHSFVFVSRDRRAVFLTDLEGPERVVLRGRNWNPIGFSRTGHLLFLGRRTIIVVAADGTVLRTLRYRTSSSYFFDEATKTLYFVAPDGMLSAAEGSRVRGIGRTRERGWIDLLGERLVTLTTQGRLAILRRSDASLAASASVGAKQELDGVVAASDDGRLFAFSAGRSPGNASVYLLRAGEHRARRVFSHHVRPAGCGGDSVGLDANHSSFLYFSDDGSGVPESAVMAADGSITRLTPTLRALPRKASTEMSAYWEAGLTS